MLTGRMLTGRMRTGPWNDRWTGSRLPSAHGTYVGKRTYETPCRAGYRADPPKRGSHTRNTRPILSGPPVPASPACRRRKPLPAFSGSGFDDDWDDHRAASMGGAHPLADDAAHPLL